MWKRAVRRRAVEASSLLAIAAIILSACGGSDGSTAAADRQRVFESFAARAGSAAYSVYPDGVSGLLPNVKYIDTNPERKPPVRLSEPIVVGRIESVQDGQALTWADESAWGREHPGEPYEDTPIVLPFDDKQAMIRTLLIKVSVRERIDLGPKPEVVAVEVVVDGTLDIGVARRGLESLGTVLLFLVEGDLFQQDQDIFRIAYEGEMLATVGSSGQIRFPAMGERDPHFRGGINTLSDLKRAARAQERFIELDM